MIHIGYALIIGLVCLGLGAIIGGLVIECAYQTKPKMTIAHSINPYHVGQYVKISDVPYVNQKYEGEIKL